MSPNATGALRIPWAAPRPVPTEPARTEAEDETLARRAAAGDGAAFATLYDRYERRAYNLCYRITGSAEDAADATQETFVAVLERLPRLEGRDLNFGAYVMTAARNASYDAIARRKRAVPSGDIDESAVPVLAGGDPDGPERHALRAAHQEQIRAANETLPARQREVLALRELEELSYDEVAEIMGMNRNSVAQLISRARINLRDGLRQTALGSVAGATLECDRALPLLAMRQDGVLDEDAGWLAEHLVGCGTCKVRVDAMEEAGVAYRVWVPLVPALWLRTESIAHAAERVGADWSEHADTPRPRSRHLRLVAAGGAILSLAFVLGVVDLAQSPTRTPAPPAPEPTAAPVEVAAAPADVAPRAFETGRRRAAPKPRAKAPVEVVAVSEAPPVPGPTAQPGADAPAAPASPVVHRARPQRRKATPPAIADAPAADPVVAETPPEPAVATEDPAPEPPEGLCPGPRCPGGGSVTTPPCTGSACRPPVVTCTTCGTVVVTPPPRRPTLTAPPEAP
jgi:RNA polymerase sigma-70 factor (ECF subfamily)